MTEITVTFEDQDTKARYLARAGDVEAELVLSKTSETLWIAEHTGVPDAGRGLGLGKAMVAQMVVDARAGDRKILPLCPFVMAQAQRNAEWRDAFQL